MKVLSELAHFMQTNLSSYIATWAELAFSLCGCSHVSCKLKNSSKEEIDGKWPGFVHGNIYLFC